MKRIKVLPKNALYLYTTEDHSGVVTKVYKSKCRLFLVVNDIVISYTHKDIRELSSRLTVAYGKIKNQTE